MKPPSATNGHHLFDKPDSPANLQAEISSLRDRLREAEETLSAIRNVSSVMGLRSPAQVWEVPSILSEIDPSHIAATPQDFAEA